MDDFTRALVQFTLDSADKCSRNWLLTVIEWQARALAAQERAQAGEGGGRG